MANSDDFTLDDHFVSSAANKISPAQLEERERQKAIKGIFGHSCLQGHPRRLPGIHHVDILVLGLYLLPAHWEGVCYTEGPGN